MRMSDWRSDVCSSGLPQCRSAPKLTRGIIVHECGRKAFGRWAAILTPPLLHLEPCLNAIDRPAPEMVPHGFPVGNTFSAGCQQSVTIMVKQPPVGLTAFIDRQRCDHEIADIAQTVEIGRDPFHIQSLMPNS